MQGSYSGTSMRLRARASKSVERPAAGGNRPDLRGESLRSSPEQPRYAGGQFESDDFLHPTKPKTAYVLSTLSVSPNPAKKFKNFCSSTPERLEGTREREI